MESWSKKMKMMLEDEFVHRNFSVGHRFVPKLHRCKNEGNAWFFSVIIFTPFIYLLYPIFVQFGRFRFSFLKVRGVCVCVHIYMMHIHIHTYVCIYVCVCARVYYFLGGISELSFYTIYSYKKIIFMNFSLNRVFYNFTNHLNNNNNSNS